MLQSNTSRVSFALPDLDIHRRVNNNTTDLITSNNGRISIPSIIDSTIQSQTSMLKLNLEQTQRLSPFGKSFKKGSIGEGNFGRNITLSRTSFSLRDDPKVVCKQAVLFKNVAPAVSIDQQQYFGMRSPGISNDKKYFSMKSTSKSLL